MEIDSGVWQGGCGVNKYIVEIQQSVTTPVVVEAASIEETVKQVTYGLGESLQASVSEPSVTSAQLTEVAA